jgi:hypothetical protein
VEKGANPVHYIATNGMVWEADGRPANQNKEDYFKTNIKRYISLMGQMQDAIQKNEQANMHMVDELRMLDSFLIKHIFAYLKPFDASKTDADEENYYLEREWRIVGDVQFTLDDITRILIPCKYGKQLREALPQYFGQISFSE